MLTHILIILAAQAMCYCDRIFVNLADGGKSNLIKLMPLEHNHNYDDKTIPPEPLSVPHPEALSADRSTDYPGEKEEERESEIYPEYDKVDTDKPMEQNTKSTDNVMLKDEVENVTQQSEMMPSTSSTTRVVTTKIITTPGITTTTETTPLATTMPEKASSRHPTTMSSPESTFFSSQPEPSCHEECLKALNETQLYAEDDWVGQGTNITLTCELPLSSAFVLEDLIWLFQPENPVPQCSLTAQEFVHPCEGFQKVSDTKDINETFVRESVTLANVLANYSGKYMCQVRLTCCPKSQEHVMSEERELQVTIGVWYADYTYDLAVAGSIAAVLAVVVVVGSIYMYRRQKTQYTVITDDIQEVKPCTVLHIPLVDDDDDNESFDSNFDNESDSNFEDRK